MSDSNYAQKRVGKNKPGPSGARPRRRCSKCGQTLAGRRGHGRVSPDGKSIYCGGCA